MTAKESGTWATVPGWGRGKSGRRWRGVSRDSGLSRPLIWSLEEKEVTRGVSQGRVTPPWGHRALSWAPGTLRNQDRALGPRRGSTHLSSQGSGRLSRGSELRAQPQQLSKTLSPNKELGLELGAMALGSPAVRQNPSVCAQAVGVGSGNPQEARTLGLILRDVAQVGGAPGTPLASPRYRERGGTVGQTLRC